MERVDEDQTYELGQVKADLVAGGTIEAPYTFVWKKEIEERTRSSLILSK